MLPELGSEAEPNALEREFSSADNVLSYAETVELLKRHRLTMDDDEPDDGELLR
jgi:hypothetical protein